MEKEYWFVVLTGILSGGIVFGSKLFADMGISLYQMTLIPSLIGLAITFPLFITKKRYLLNKEMIKFFVLFGLIGSIGVLAQYTSVILGVPVPVVVLLLYTQPLWTILYSGIFLKEKITKIKIIAIITVLLGVILIVNPLKIKTIGNLPGIIAALLGGLALSGWVILGSISGKKEYKPITTFFVGGVFATLFTLIYYPLFRYLIKDPSLTSFSFNLPVKIWIYMLIYQSLLRIIPHTLYYTGTRKVSTSDAGVILLLEPVSAAILSSLFLGDRLTVSVIIGGILILIANYLVIKEKG
ncbi:MAG: EamA family transporter [Candidatus Aenigmarchaeota archaeon]|nr:EamA family transporter [Candidatus Aenigmarchaeota archaeon]